ncbi:glycosyltransferase family 4 protein [Candidatus Gottesmanbacteria bacterium]|nr:glycosyltransferase family 4 protein [Candidatus Gottesmanbacteria bacterium]
MVIAIDGYEANVPKRVGIGRYAYEILKHMFQNFKIQNSKFKIQNEIQFRIYLPNPPLNDMPQETEWWQYRVVRLRSFWTFTGLPLALWLDRPRADVIFSPTHYVPRFITIPRVMSVMDLSYLEYPQMFRAKDLHQLVYWTAYSVRHAAKILTISEFSTGAIMKAYGVPKDRIAVTYPGISMNSKLKTQNSKLFDKYGILKQYILSVGTLQPRKNYSRLIEAFSRLVKQEKGFDDVELVIVGKKGWLYEEILKAPRQFGVADRVKFLEFVPDADLPDLYRHALCFALPSLYEGFGLPVLEAMANGCPVVVSSASSLPEIAGDAGIYVDPNDVASIIQGLLKGLRETKEERKHRTEEGLRQAEKFSWQKAARETLAILQDVAKQK